MKQKKKKTLDELQFTKLISRQKYVYEEITLNNPVTATVPVSHSHKPILFLSSMNKDWLPCD